jgi:dTDP-L-rhamnose 4-epimerase
MSQQILITGGAGFIGSHVADELLAHGHRVRALDNLTLQVHPDRTRPAYLNPEIELVVGDVRDRDSVRRALRNVDAVTTSQLWSGSGRACIRSPTTRA